MTKARSGAVFELGDCTPADFPGLLQVLELYPKQRELLQGIFDLCTMDAESGTDMPTLCEHLNIARPTVLQRLAPLMELGLVCNQMRQVHERARSVNVYQLQRPPALPISLPPAGGAPASEVPSSQGHFEFSGQDLAAHRELHYHPDVHRRMKWKADRLIVLSFLAGLRVGKTGADLHRKETRIYMGDRYFNLEVRAPAPLFIPGVLDLRVLIVVFSLIRNSLAHAKSAVTAEDGYVMKMSEICQAMGLEAIAGNKRHLFEQLHRWRSSEFLITADHGALDFANDTFEENRSFNVIAELNVLKHVSAEGKVPELVHLTLPSGILKELRDQNRTLSMHQEIIRERKPKPYYHLVYFWCRRVVKHAVTPRIYTLSHLHREIQPKMTLKRFRAVWLEVLRDHQVSALEGTAKIPGYLIRYNRQREEAAIVADPTDPIVGENSPYQLAEEQRTD